MQRIYAAGSNVNRKLKHLYEQSGIHTRYSVIPDYTSAIGEWRFYPPTENLCPFPSLEQRMHWYHQHAAPLSQTAIERCLDGLEYASSITHLITVSCTGMSAPGLDLELVGKLGLSPSVFRTSVNFMGCYAAIHGLKLADALVRSSTNARVLVVCTELCTLHFQQEPTLDNMLSSLLFADGSAAVLVVPADDPRKGLKLTGFYSLVDAKGKDDMTWNLSAEGFRMTLSGYVPDLIKSDFASLVGEALSQKGTAPEKVTHWCIHPGGRKILDSIQKSMDLPEDALNACYEILGQYGNMSSPSLLFILQRIWQSMDDSRSNCIFGAAFGPGLTMETFIAEPVGI